MKNLSKEIREELSSVLLGKTIDMLIPPLIFVAVNAVFGLEPAVMTALGLAFGLGVWRIFRKQTWVYALGGLLAVALASGLAFITRSAASYFIPAIISNGIILLIALASLMIGKPLAALASHLTRGWTLDWFWREDVKPAYREVTWLWLVFLSLRLIIQVGLFLRGDAAALAWANTLLGWPVTIFVLVVSYIYGIWRLKNLAGPGVDEFVAEKAPPWDGQKRGF